MSQTPGKGFPSAHRGQTQTLFYTEGNPAAMLVTDRAGQMSKKEMTLATSEAALAWCKQRRVNFYWMPADVRGN